MDVVSSMLAAMVLFSLCPAAAPPVEGPVIEPFAPIGRYAGHWGVDYAVPAGTDVGSVAAGIVSFAGPVAGRFSVSVDHGRGFVSTVSYLSSIGVARGEQVALGAVVASAGTPHGGPGVHLSLRLAGNYVDPNMLFTCRVSDVTDALRLVPIPG